MFDKVIRTQEDFEALIASPTWLDAVSVCFVGDGGTLKFMLSYGFGTLIPQTVKQIQGVNSATIVSTDFDDSSVTGIFGYYSIPTESDYRIDGIKIEFNATFASAAGFYNCYQLTNCSAVGNGYGVIRGFLSCDKLVNCSAVGEGSSTGFGFTNCNSLVNCVGIGISDTPSCGFFECHKLINCDGTGTSSLDIGYGFEACSYIINCVGSTASTTALFGSGNIYVSLTEADFATQVEAEAFTNNTKVMTPLRTSESIEKWVSTTYTDVSLLSANWTGSVAPFTYTLTLTGVKATGTEQTFLPQLSATTAQLEAIQGANLQDGGQALNTVTILAYGEKPIIDLPLRYKISGVK